MMKPAAAWMVGGLLLLVASSGCSDGGAKGDDDKVDYAETENSDTKGSISGVVVDAAIRPLPGVVLTLGPTGTNATTNVDGQFQFVDLEPGLFTVSAAPLAFAGQRFLGIQTTAEVQAGVTSKVRMVLPLDPTPQPYHGPTLGFDGFFQVGTGFVDEVLELSVYNKTIGPVTTPSATCTCSFGFDVDEAVETLVLELTYVDSVPNPMPFNGWTMDLYSVGDGRTNDLLFCEATPPCIFRLNGTLFSNTSREFHLGVWSDPAWIHVQQRFQVFVTPFYGARAPEEWSFLAGSL